MDFDYDLPSENEINENHKSTHTDHHANEKSSPMPTIDPIRDNTIDSGSSTAAGESHSPGKVDFDSPEDSPNSISTDDQRLLTTIDSHSLPKDTINTIETSTKSVEPMYSTTTSLTTAKSSTKLDFDYDTTETAHTIIAKKPEENTHMENDVATSSMPHMDAPEQSTNGPENQHKVVVEPTTNFAETTDSPTPEKHEQVNLQTTMNDVDQTVETTMSTVNDIEEKTTIAAPETTTMLSVDNYSGNILTTTQATTIQAFQNEVDVKIISSEEKITTVSPDRLQKDEFLSTTDYWPEATTTHTNIPMNGDAIYAEQSTPNGEIEAKATTASVIEEKTTIPPSIVTEEMSIDNTATTTVISVTEPKTITITADKSTETTATYENKPAKGDTVIGPTEMFVGQTTTAPVKHEEVMETLTTQSQLLAAKDMGEQTTQVIITQKVDMATTPESTFEEIITETTKLPDTVTPSTPIAIATTDQPNSGTTNHDSQAIELAPAGGSGGGGGAAAVHFPSIMVLCSSFFYISIVFQ